MDRRTFLHTLGGIAAVPAAGCASRPAPQECSTAPVIQRVIDAHCHVFNAADLQVHDYVEKIVAHESHIEPQVAKFAAWLLSLLAHLADDATQEAGDLTRASTLGAFQDGSILEQLRRQRRDEDDRIDEALTLELNRNPELRAAALSARQSAMLRRNLLHLPALELGVPLSVGQVRRMFGEPGLKEAREFVRPMLRRRGSNISALLDAHGCGEGGTSGLFPALVDFDGWLGTGPTRSRIGPQIEVMGLLADLLPVPIRTYLPYNPLISARDPDYWPILQKAAVRPQFVGFKLYPPMGFAPHGNALIESGKRPAAWAKLPKDVPEKLDAAMKAFLEWCVANDIPVMAHGNPSHGADDKAVLLGSPKRWREAITLAGGKLRFCAGHFGGEVPRPGRPDWTREWAELMHDFEHTYADLSYWDSVIDGTLGAAKLGKLLIDFPILRQRLMYGSDWSMLALEENWEAYRSRFVTTLQPVFRNDMPAIMGRNAIAFAGPRFKP